MEISTSLQTSYLFTDMDRYTFKITYAVSVVAHDEDEAREMADRYVKQECEMELVDVEPVSLEEMRFTE